MQEHRCHASPDSPVSENIADDLDPPILTENAFGGRFGAGKSRPPSAMASTSRAHITNVMVEGIHHTLYTGDITIGTNTGSPAQIEERLQKAALLVDTYAASCGLECSPAKSALLSVSRLPPPQIFLPSGPIPAVKNIRILGLHLTSYLDPKGTIAGTSKLVSRTIRCVSTRRGGHRGTQSLRLAHVFVTSRVLYASPYLRLRRHHERQLDVLLRSVYKRALDLPIATSKSRFAALGVHNSIAELREAHRARQSDLPSGFNRPAGGSPASGSLLAL
ncbi:hypothetical protein HPB52_009101 [Rhipicephalus sanguineus]|uniref:Tick transposon n=1 Tax=Rhipicephalus sanguineus TaxID=34632 RepID=A0A9D4Q5Y4_RHISA|nr:hypothetical protein HPB52_009101 [Rhipicephalus sanguineus]